MQSPRRSITVPSGHAWRVSEMKMASDYCILLSELCLSAEAWAGWAQATGGMLAVFVAFKVANSQLRHTQRRELRAEADKVRARALLLEECIAAGRTFLAVQRGGVGGKPQGAAVEQGQYYELMKPLLELVPWKAASAGEAEELLKLRKALVPMNWAAGQDQMTEAAMDAMQADLDGMTTEVLRMRKRADSIEHGPY